MASPNDFEEAFANLDMGRLAQRGARGFLIVVTTFVLAVVLLGGFLNVPVGKNVVVYNKLTRNFEPTRGSGLQWIAPIINERISYDIRKQIYDMKGDESLQVITQDGLQMQVDMTVQFQLSPDLLDELHATVGRDYEKKIIYPGVRSEARTVFSRYEATESFSQRREQIAVEIFDLISNRIGKDGIQVNEVLIRDIVLPPTVRQAIEDKKQAQQRAEKMEYVLQEEESKKQQLLIQAQAQAERIQVINDAISSNPFYLQWFSIDKLNDNVNLIISDGQTILSLDNAGRNPGSFVAAE